MGHGMLQEMWKNFALLKIEYCSTYLALCVLADTLNAENNYTNWYIKISFIMYPWAHIKQCGEKLDWMTHIVIILIQEAFSKHKPSKSNQHLNKKHSESTDIHYA